MKKTPKTCRSTFLPSTFMSATSNDEGLCEAGKDKSGNQTDTDDMPDTQGKQKPRSIKPTIKVFSNVYIKIPFN